MAYFYVGGNRNQSFLLPVSMADWLEEGHLAWFVIDVVGTVDTAAFHARHPNDGVGRPAYDPDMMLALLLYAYGMGLRSSRRIEAACGTDAAFRVIAGGVIPDHATIARFLADHQAAIEAVFVDVLRLCAAAGLASVGTIAIDATLVGADAALDKNRGADWIRQQVEAIVAEATVTDAAEDARPGLFGALELPAELCTPKGRRARLEAALAQIEAQDAAAKASADERAAKARAAAVEGRKLRGRKPKDPTPRWPEPKPKPTRPRHASGPNAKPPNARPGPPRRGGTRPGRPLTPTPTCNEPSPPPPRPGPRPTPLHLPPPKQT